MVAWYLAYNKFDHTTSALRKKEEWNYNDLETNIKNKTFSFIFGIKDIKNHLCAC